MAENELQVAYPVHIYPDRCSDGSFCYVAEHPDLPGCGAHGDTIEEARQLLDFARAAYIKHLLATSNLTRQP